LPERCAALCCGCARHSWPVATVWLASLTTACLAAVPLTDCRRQRLGTCRWAGPSTGPLGRTAFFPAESFAFAISDFVRSHVWLRAARLCLAVWVPGPEQWLVP
jgi:hypothetical protein